MKKIFSRESLLIALILGLLGHNIYLQTRIEKVIETAQDAESYARDAADYAYETLGQSYGTICDSCPL